MTDDLPQLGDAAILEGLNKHIKEFFAAGVELGFFEVMGSDDDGEVRYRSTAKWKEAGDEEATQIIGRYLRERGEKA